MNYTELTQCSFLLDEDHFIYDTSEDSETVHLFIKSKPHECSCPTCGTLCRTLTATYQRTLQDTPIHGKQTFLHANLYKYSCSNPTAPDRSLLKLFLLPVLLKFEPMPSIPLF
ncbi:transposase family protein [Enterococcus avium]